jgi:hypothetical protein
MFALAHPQITRTVPFYPPTDLVFYRANPAIALDVDRAADALVRFFDSCREEMAVAIRTMGHLKVSDLSRDDLCALDPAIAAEANVRYVGDDRNVDGTGAADHALAGARGTGR